MWKYGLKFCAMKSYQSRKGINSNGIPNFSGFNHQINKIQNCPLTIAVATIESESERKNLRVGRKKKNIKRKKGMVKEEMKIHNVEEWLLKCSLLSGLVSNETINEHKQNTTGVLI